MSRIARLLRKQRVKASWLAAAVLAGLLLHIGAVLAITHLGSNPAIVALSSLGPVNQMSVLPPVTPGHQPLPFLSPAERYAVCRFDLRKGPVAVHAVLGGDDWVVAIYAPTGANVFNISGADLERREIELVLAGNGETKGPPLPIARDAGLSTTVGLAARTGIAVISAPGTRLADAGSVEKLLSQATCTPRTRSGLPGPG